MDLSRVEIPAPYIGTQQKVVDILDRFDTLAKSLTDGIPVEIEARNQQGVSRLESTRTKGPLRTLRHQSTQ